MDENRMYYIPFPDRPRTSRIRPQPVTLTPKSTKTFGEMSRMSRELDSRLDRLEAKARQDREPTRDQETSGAWAKDMEKLAIGSYAEKQAVYRKHQDAGLSPHEAKAKCQADLEDERWVQQMQTLVGDSYAKKRELWEGGQNA